jgi:Ser/Thr protein kinase RdoA (MazF antagonist)
MVRSMSDEKWGPDRAGAALAAVSAELGLRAEPLLIRASGNVVYRCGDHIAKVYRPTDVIPRMATAARTAGALAAAGAPVVAPAFDGTLFEHPDGVVSFWPTVESIRTPTLAELGTLLRQFHTVGAVVVADLDLERWPGTISTRWATGPYRDTAGANRTLADTIDAYAVELEERCAVMPAGPLTVLHGDPDLSNTLVGPDGPVLIDTDWVCAGPAVMDLADVVCQHRDAKVGDDDYAAFVGAYGSDPAALDGVELGVQVRAFHGLVFRLAMACRYDQDLSWLVDETALQLGR